MQSTMQFTINSQTIDYTNYNNTDFFLYIDRMIIADKWVISCLGNPIDEADKEHELHLYRLTSKYWSWRAYICTVYHCTDAARQSSVLWTPDILPLAYLPGEHVRTGTFVLLHPLNDVRCRHFGLAAADLARLYITCRPIPVVPQQHANAFGGR